MRISDWSSDVCSSDLDDMVIPPAKEEMVSETKTLVKHFEQQYQDGLITQGEKYNKVVDACARCGDRVAEGRMKRLSSKQKLDNGREKPMNAIYMIPHSSASDKIGITTSTGKNG